jgi:hypothetical protein
LVLSANLLLTTNYCREHGFFAVLSILIF